MNTITEKLQFIYTYSYSTYILLLFLLSLIYCSKQTLNIHNVQIKLTIKNPMISYGDTGLHVDCNIQMAIVQTETKFL